MKKILSKAAFLTAILFSSSILFAQHKLEKLWETDSVLKVPESVLFDGDNKVLYASNIDGTDPWAKDGKGSIAKVGLDGKVIATEWVSGLNAPKGIGIYKGKLYVADLNELVVIDIAGSKIEKRIVVTGAEGLNDVSVSKSGTVYVSDSKLKKIFTVKNACFSRGAKKHHLGNETFITFCIPAH
jgi:sugar lactone lactonase YvrE